MSSDESEQRMPRQRATVACNFCRQRKRRCDGQRPICFNCQTANVECRYVDVEQRRFDVDASLSAVGERLDRLESMVRDHSNALSRIETAPTPTSVPIQYASHTSNPDSHDGVSPHGSGMSHIATPSGWSNVTMTTGSAAELPPMTIPLWHSTTTGSLLSCPQVKSSLGDYPDDVFLRTEERRTLPESLSIHGRASGPPKMPVLDRAITDGLVEIYFQSVNMQHPVLSYDECVLQYHSIASKPLSSSLETSAVLLMLALAEAARTLPPQPLGADWSPGSEYFLPALLICLEEYLKSSATTIALPRCLYLAALYYNYLARPLDAWKLVHMASTSFQRLWIKSKPSLQVDEVRHQPLVRLCWAIFALECDLIAEHHLPRSGVENVVEKLNLPLCGDPPNPSLLGWLAELSARRLLNRVHHIMYAEDHKYLLQADYTDGRQETEAVHRVMGSLKISNELDGQLQNWFDLIPSIIKPDLMQLPTGIAEAMIVLRYHSAKDIIFRPFLLFACSLPPTVRPPQSLLDLCHTTIYSCRQYVQSAAVRLREPSASTEIVIHSVFASTVIITMAALNPWLEEHVPDIDALQSLAISAIQLWAFPGSCIEAMALMLGAMQSRIKILRTGMK